MDTAVRPVVSVARMRALAASRGVSLEGMAEISPNVLEGGGEQDESQLGGELARAVLHQQETQRRAATMMQMSWRRRKARRFLNKRFEARKIKLEEKRQYWAAICVQRAWTSAKLRHELARKVERTRLWIEAERDAGARTLQRLCRRRKDAKELTSRFTVRKIILEQASGCFTM